MQNQNSRKNLLAGNTSLQFLQMYDVEFRGVGGGVREREGG